MTSPLGVAVCVPTRNPGRWTEPLIEALLAQRPRPAEILVIDTASTDGSVEQWRAAGFRVLPIEVGDFDHGGTRNLAVSATEAEVVVFLTQDAIPVSPASIDTLVEALRADPAIGVAYGRQVPRPDADPLTRAHQEFNYPDEPSRRTAADVANGGVRAAFCSNAFAAWRRSALDAIGGFPTPTVHSEDRLAGARLLDAGWAIVYVPGAVVEHSHHHRPLDDFRRYFDIGAAQAADPFFEGYLGGSSREGGKLVRRQLGAARAAGVPLAAARVLARSGFSLAAFRLGRLAPHLPTWVNTRCSSNPGYWSRRRVR